MNRTLSILIFFTVLNLFSCKNDDVLDKKPLDIISDALVWNDQSLIDAYLTNIYHSMSILTNEVADNSQYGGTSWFNIVAMHEISDEAKGNWTTNTAYAYRFGLDISGWIYGQWALLPWWEESYKIIRALNEFVEKVPDSQIPEDYKKSKIAEAKFLRAFNYFAMVKRYGGVPLITKTQKVDDPYEVLYPRRDKEKVVYDFILSEMDAIASDLPEARTASDYGKPSKYAAIALKCRAALYAASIAKYGRVQLDGIVGIERSCAQDYFLQAYNAAQDIIKSSRFLLFNKYDDKVENFKNIFLEKNNVEVIFARVHDANDGDQGGQGWACDFFQCPVPNGYGQGNQSAPYLEIAESFEYVDGSSGKLDEAVIQSKLWTTEELWANKEPRFFATLYTHNTFWQGNYLDFHNGLRKPDGKLQRSGSYNGVLAQGTQRPNGNFGTGFGILKYLNEKHNNLQPKATSDQDWIIFRYAEILLNFAEAAFELEKENEALDAVNLIRNRAGVAPLTGIDMERIRHERKVELAFEGHRYWDLRRWRIAEDVLSKNYSGLRFILDYNTRKLEVHIIRDIDGTVKPPLFLERNYYLPITLERTGQNRNLIENPGY